MTDELSVKYSLGFVEGWIEKATATYPDLNNTDSALEHLKIIEEGYDEYRQKIEVFRKITANLKNQISGASNL